MKSFLRHMVILTIIALLCYGCASHRGSTAGEEKLPKHETSPQAVEHFIRGVIFDQQGDISRAISEYRRALMYDSTSASIHLAMAEDYFALKLYDDALNQLYQALEIDSLHVEVLLFLSDLLIKKNQHDSATFYMQRLVDNYPEKIDQRLNLAGLFLSLNRVEDAIAQYQIILEQHPEEMEALSQLNTIYISKGEFDKALDVTHKMYAIDEQNDRVCFTLASLYAQNNQVAEADSFFTRAVGLNPDDPRYFTNWAFLHVNNDAPQKAASILLDATYHHPTSADIWGLLGSAYQQSNQDSLALEALDVSLELDATKLGSYITLGFIYDERGDIEKATEVYEQALTVAPDDALVLNNYAYLLAQAGERLGEALSMVERALELSPDNPSYLDTKGWVYYMLDDYQSAIDFIERALALEPENAAVLDHLGDIYSKMGEGNKARKFWRDALDYDPQNLSIREKLAQ